MMDLVQVVSFIKVIVRGEGGNYFLRLGDWGPFDHPSNSNKVDWEFQCNIIFFGSGWQNYSVNKS